MAEGTPLGTPSNAQRRRVRRNALLFGLLAFGIYATFIVYAVLHGRS
jgi:hypothetical protein